MIKFNIFSSFKETYQAVFRKNGNIGGTASSVSGNFNCEDIPDAAAYANTGNQHKRSSAPVDIIRLT